MSIPIPLALPAALLLAAWGLARYQSRGLGGPPRGRCEDIGYVNIEARRRLGRDA